MPTATTQKPASGNPSMTRKIRPGFVSHTELASSNPAATRKWCEAALGWKFGEAMPTPDGPYEMWRFDEGSGGGIRGTAPTEAPGAIPYVEVEDTKAAFNKAVKAGAKPMVPPNEIPGGNGWIAVVQAPGGPSIGFWGQK